MRAGLDGVGPARTRAGDGSPSPAVAEPFASAGLPLARELCEMHPRSPPHTRPSNPGEDINLVTMLFWTEKLTLHILHMRSTHIIQVKKNLCVVCTIVQFMVVSKKLT